MTSTLRELWDTTRMRLLVEIERQGSVSAAAAAIGIGQPSASQHLRLLEAAAAETLPWRSISTSRRIRVVSQSSRSVLVVAISLSDSSYRQLRLARSDVSP